MIRRGRRKQNLKDFTKDSLIRHAKQLLYNRWMLLTPPPVEPDKVYDTLLTDEQHRAMELLDATMPSCLERGSQVNVIFDVPAQIKTPIHNKIHEAKYLQLHLPNQRILPNTETYTGTRSPHHRFLVSALPSDMRESLQEWARNWMRAQAETAEVIDKLDSLFTACNTLGQAKRIWPQITGLLTEQAQNKLAQAKVRSPYPDGVLLRDPDVWDDKAHNYKLIGLRKEWEPPALQWYDDRLTESLCLPMQCTLEDSQLERFSLKIDYKFISG
jgi:hypothetical protein